MRPSRRRARTRPFLTSMSDVNVVASAGARFFRSTARVIAARSRNFATCPAKSHNLLTRCSATSRHRSLDDDTLWDRPAGGTCRTSSRIPDQFNHSHGHAAFLLE